MPKAKRQISEDEWTQFLADNSKLVVESVYGSGKEAFRQLARAIMKRASEGPADDGKQ